MNEENPFEDLAGAKIKRDKIEDKKKPGRPTTKPDKLKKPTSYERKYERSLLAQIINGPLEAMETGKVPTVTGTDKITLGGAIAYDLEYYGVKSTVDHPILVTLIGLYDAVTRALKIKQGTAKPAKPVEVKDSYAGPRDDIR